MRNILALTCLLCACTTVPMNSDSVEKSRELYSSGEQQQATEMLERLSSQDNHEAQYELATILIFNGKTQSDKDTAFQLVGKSCEAGFWRACAAYSTRLIAREEYSKAENVLLHNIEFHNDLAAMNNIISLYENEKWPGASKVKAEKYRSLYDSLK